MYALIRVTGAVQGIGYRPFVAELATKYELRGEVKNLGGIVEIIAIGDEDRISLFADKLKTSSPSGSIVINVSLEYLKENEPEGLNDCSGFRIVESSEKFDKSYLTVFPPDIGICEVCMQEMGDENDRRYEYPLISCASCGPRFSILKKLPYDRETTTMDVYSMCPECSSEYKKGRRRHAQTISCHSCGPQIIFDEPEKRTDESDDSGIERAAFIIKSGGIIGIKGIGGYQLAVDPCNYDAVRRLREIKGREKKPFAIMYPDMSAIKECCNVSSKEEELLTSSARPIVLLDRHYANIHRSDNKKEYADNVCGVSRQIGAFLPSSGLHKLLTEKTGEIIVTSGNISGDSMIVADDIFREKFADKIDGILWYEREILRPLDDSVIQIFRDDCQNEETRFIRRSRGYVPLPLFLEKALTDKVIYEAFGADLKNTFSLGYGDRIITSQFLGDMEEYSVLKLQKREYADFRDIFRVDNLDADKKIIISDMHPGYHSTKLAQDVYNNSDKNKTELLAIQHHHAHIGSVMAEYSLNECIGIAFDGTGYGTDGKIWGSEFLICRGGEFERAGHLKPVRIVGQDEGMKNAALSAACYLLEGNVNIPEGILQDSELSLIKAALNNNINAFPNSGMGRLFDAVSCLLGICSYNSYEGECAIKLQNAAEEYLNRTDKDVLSDDSDELSIFLDIENATGENNTSSYVMDTANMLDKLIKLKANEDTGKLAYAFHKAIAKAVKSIALSLREKSGLNDICLSGGVFANRLLLYMCNKFLKEEGFVVYYNRILPTNDGGISAGQIYLAGLLNKS